MPIACRFRSKNSCKTRGAILDVRLEQLGERRLLCAGVVDKEPNTTLRFDAEDRLFGFRVGGRFKRDVCVTPIANPHEQFVFALREYGFRMLAAQRLQVRARLGLPAERKALRQVWASLHAHPVRRAIRNCGHQWLPERVLRASGTEERCFWNHILADRACLER